VAISSRIGEFIIGVSNADIKALKEVIDKWDQEQCAHFWRFAKSSHPIIQVPELFTYFRKRFEALGGMTPTISKRIGLD